MMDFLSASQAELDGLTRKDTRSGFAKACSKLDKPMTRWSPCART